MQHLDLFSGIGGFALATEIVWPDVKHTFCDIEPFAQIILKKHWPEAMIYGDIRSLTADAESARIRQNSIQPQRQARIRHAHGRNRRTDGAQIDLLTGGFPCQPFSVAGKRKGTADDRHLWPEMLRVIREFHPRWIIGENVGGFVTWDGGVVLEQVHTDLESAGYEVQAFIIPAAACNAPHRRDRIWIVAHAHDPREPREPRDKIPGRQSSSIPYSEFGGRSGGGSGVHRQSADVADAPLGRKQSRHKAARSPLAERGRGDWERSWLEVATELCRVDDGLPPPMDRTHRLKALGNAIVPQVAAEIMRAIKKIDEL